MRRRDFIQGIAGSAAALPFAVRAQQKLPVIGFLSVTSAVQWTPYTDSFAQGLAEAGFAPEKDVKIEYHWANGKYDVLPNLVADFITEKVDLIIAVAPPAALAAKKATAEIPIVFASGVDPIRLGLVQSYNRPGGNVTGVNFFTAELGAKLLDVLLEIVPQANLIGVLVNPNNPNTATQTRELSKAVEKRRRAFKILQAKTADAIDAAFIEAAKQKIDALIIATDAFFLSRKKQMVNLPRRYKIPTMYALREYASAGGLVSYGTNLSDVYKEIGRYAGRILKGAAPSDLPVLRPTRLELVINIATANALGLQIPQPLLATADEVIE